jgi:hypothetical protein
MTAKTIKLPSLTAGLTLTCLVRNPSTLALLETVALAAGSGDDASIYTGTVTGAHAGQLLFEVLVSGTVLEKRLRTITDTAATFVILTELEERANNGRGAHPVAITITDLDDVELENADIRAVSGILGGSGITGPDGVKILSLNSATYTITITCPGFEGLTEELVISGTTAITYQLTPRVVTLPEAPGMATGVLVALDEMLNVEPGVDVHIQLVTGRGIAGFTLDTKIRTQTTNSEGAVEFTRLAHGAKYSVWSGAIAEANTSPFAVRGRSNKATFTVPVADNFNIAEFLRLDPEE